MESSGTIQNLKLLIPLIYIIPSYILYAVIFYVVYFTKNKHKFNGAFNKLFAISGIVYVICSITYFFALRVPNTPLFIPFAKKWGIKSVFITLLQTTLWYTCYIAPLFHVVISFNRFTVFKLKTNYEHFWKKWLKFLVAFCLLFLCCLIWHTPLTGIFMQLKNESDPDSLRYIAETDIDAIPWMNTPFNAAIFMLICSSLCLFFNGFVIFRLVRERCFLIKNNQQKSTAQDVQLSIYTSFVFISDVLSTIFPVK